MDEKEQALRKEGDETCDTPLIVSAPNAPIAQQRSSNAGEETNPAALIDTLRAQLKDTETALAYKNDTANVFMNQVKKLQAQCAEKDEALKGAAACFREDGKPQTASYMDAALTTTGNTLLEERKKFIALLTEARRLMIAVGESNIVEIQFSQHGWLTEVNQLIPPTQ